MSDLEFKRGLSPDQIREALSLLDNTVRVAIGNSQLAASSAAEKVHHGTDQAGTTVRLATAEDPQQRRKHLNVAAGCYGLGIAAVAALTLLSWSDGRPAAPPSAGIEGRTLQNEPAAKSASSVLALTNPVPGQSSVASERSIPNPQVGISSSVGQFNRGDDQAAENPAAHSAIAYAARMAAIVGMLAERDERTPRTSNEPRWHARAIRVAAAKPRPWRHQWEAGSEIVIGQCRCGSWQFHQVVYDPPRNVTQ